MIACIGERSYVKVTAGTPAFCVVCDDEEVVKWYMSTTSRESGRKVVRTTCRQVAAGGRKRGVRGRQRGRA